MRAWWGRRFRVPILLFYALAAAAQRPVAEPIAVLTSTESPTVDAAGTVYFTYRGVEGGRILKWIDAPARETQPGLPDPPGRVEVFRDYGAAGLIFDHQWRLLSVERSPEGVARVSRTDVKT